MLHCRKPSRHEESASYALPKKYCPSISTCSGGRSYLTSIACLFVLEEMIEQRVEMIEYRMVINKGRMGQQKKMWKKGREEREERRERQRHRHRQGFVHCWQWLCRSTE